MGATPDGIAWPPADGWNQGGEVPFSAYIHVPFCTVRCGYCDFNTYIAQFGPGADHQSYPTSVQAEIAHSRRIVEHPRPLHSVFFGGGTPTLLAPEAIAEIIDSLAETWGFEEGAEITVEANPDTVTAQSLKQLRSYGVTRLSVGMQSAVPHVLRTLERTHNPQMIAPLAQWTREAGLALSLDLIYGTPGESLGDWETSLRAAVELRPDHLSAYSLILEPGTKLFAQVERGLVAKPDDDEAASKYLLADEFLEEAGYRWYEISNFALPTPAERDQEGLGATELTNASRHNLAYWRDYDWWGYGPGAHSHLGNGRFWNVAHPRAYANAVLQGGPERAGEVLDAQTRDFERLMLAIRTAEGARASWDPRLEGLVQRQDDRLILTRQGRLLADYVTRFLAGWE